MSSISDSTIILSDSDVLELQDNVDLVLDGNLNGKFTFNTNDVIGKGAFGIVFRGQYISLITYFQRVWPRVQNPYRHIF